LSGIAGIVRLDGSAANARPLIEAIAHRGPDGLSEWSSGAVSLAHALLRTTADDVSVVVDGDVIVVADARIDEVHGAPTSLERRSAKDIVSAWRLWGENCPSHLDGDFAFALWDVRTRTLFCARDHFGVKPFVYTLLPGKLFAFGSEYGAVLALEEVPRTLDDDRIREFLDFRFEDADRTFYRNLLRLPPASTLTLRDGRVAIRRYWSIRNVKPLRLKGGDQAYAEGYREHFIRAVRARTRVAQTSELGAMLSGGLDSSAIACVARDELRAAGSPPLPVFSWVFSDAREADEREYQEAVIGAGGMRAVTLDSANLDAGPWSDLDALLPGGPPFAYNHYLNVQMAKAARAIGVRTLLDGLGGDMTVSRGSARFVELFIRGRLVTLARELRALASRRGTSESLARLFLANVVVPVSPAALIQLTSRLIGRPLARPRHLYTARQEHLAQFEGHFLAEGLELCDRTIAWLGVEGRYPFFDRRLVEYCLSLPADQKLADGYTRIVARRAMEGIVPDRVRWRPGKGIPGLHVIRALRAQPEQLDRLLTRDLATIDAWVDVDRVRMAYSELTTGRAVTFRAVYDLWSAAVLARWLQRR
jgi:asparagine synthase (glutamine-hydrolysing)